VKSTVTFGLYEAKSHGHRKIKEFTMEAFLFLFLKCTAHSDAMDTYISFFDKPRYGRDKLLLLNYCYSKIHWDQSCPSMLELFGPWQQKNPLMGTMS
jgi:hypothetical protein